MPTEPPTKGDYVSENEIVYWTRNENRWDPDPLKRLLWAMACEIQWRRLMETPGP